MPCLSVYLLDINKRARTHKILERITNISVHISVKRQSIGQAAKKKEKMLKNCHCYHYRSIIAWEAYVRIATFFPRRISSDDILFSLLNFHVITSEIRWISFRLLVSMNLFSGCYLVLSHAAWIRLLKLDHKGISFTFLQRYAKAIQQPS